MQLERNFTMNGNWMDYAGKWIKGSRTLTQAVWGNDQIPFITQYAGCQMCRGHSENGSWHDSGVRKCQTAFLEAYTFGDDQVLGQVGLSHLTMDTHLVRSKEVPLRPTSNRARACPAPRPATASDPTPRPPPPLRGRSSRSATRG